MRTILVADVEANGSTRKLRIEVSNRRDLAFTLDCELDYRGSPMYLELPRSYQTALGARRAARWLIGEPLVWREPTEEDLRPKSSPLRDTSPGPSSMATGAPAQAALSLPPAQLAWFKQFEERTNSEPIGLELLQDGEMTFKQAAQYSLACYLQQAQEAAQFLERDLQPLIADE